MQCLLRQRSPMLLGRIAGPRSTAVCPKGRALSVRVGCNAETDALFMRRLQQKGWSFPPRERHQLVSEAWKALDHIYSAVFETPLEPSPWLAQQSEGSTVLLKLESKQATGSFKVRGAVHKLLSLTPEELASGVYTSSTGNHALAVLHACQAAGRRAGVAVVPTIYLPSTASKVKVEKLQAGGAKVVFHGQDCVEAEREARRVAQERGGVYISPYNDHQVAGGQGTLALELLMQLTKEQLDTVFVPVGGGGLVSGVAAVLKAASPSIRVIGCQPEVSDVMRRSVEAGKVVEQEWQETLSDATAGGIEEGSITLEPCRQFVDDWVTVGEREIAQAMVDTTTHHGFRIEGAAGVAVAAFLQAAPRLKGKHVVVVCCGGNVSQEAMGRAYQLAASALVR